MSTKSASEVDKEVQEANETYAHHKFRPNRHGGSRCTWSADERSDVCAEPLQSTCHTDRHLYLKPEPAQQEQKKLSVYHRHLHLTDEDKENGYVTLDIYHLLKLYNVTDQNFGHAIKKLFCPGQRSGGKSVQRDVADVIWTLQRWQELDARNVDITGDPTATKSLINKT